MKELNRGPAALASCLAIAGMALAGGFDRSEAAPAARSIACDQSLKARFKPDSLTTVVLVKAFNKGDLLVLSEQSTPQTPRAPSDLCLVKLNVGPGHPGPAGAPSTSAGIGIEVWLPAKASWNGRVHAFGGGGWQGGPVGSPEAIGSPYPALIAGGEGAVSSFTDTGHSRAGSIPGTPGGGDFAMNPDGTANTVLWTDLATRSLHEQAVKTKALTEFYYGRPPKFSYWDGGSQGGRQGLSLAQNYPGDYDGIIANFPAINWSRFIIGELYPWIVFQRDLGGVPLTVAQQDLVSNAAIRACDLVGGEHLGYIMDNASCRYDPTLDKNVLCAAAGGQNSTPACVNRAQAAVFNKVWYGMTADGSAPSPAVDNGWTLKLDGPRRWYGPPRGTSLYNAYFSKLFGVIAGVTNPLGQMSYGSDMVALAWQNPTFAGQNFFNATGNGQDLWKTMSYAQLSNALDRGVALDPVFGRISTDNPDLSAFKARGGKMLTWHGTNDEVIPVQGSMQYYDRVVERMGGLANVQAFYRLYLVPGNGHAPHNGTANPAAHPPEVTASQFYELIVNWVEHGVAPDRTEIRSPANAPIRISQPICVYPRQATYVSGDPKVAASFRCS